MTDAVSRPLTPSASTTSTMRGQSSATAARVGWTSGLPRTLGPLGLVRTAFSRSSVALGTAGLDFWLAKNSWATWFGENGFFNIKRGTGHCGVGSLHYTSAYCAAA